MPYNETVIENIPLGLIEWRTGYGFPNHSEFKPTLPKWWENMQVTCWNDDCCNRYFLRDVEVRDPFVDQPKFCGSEYYVRFNCPKCGQEGFVRELLFDIIKDQVFDHINKYIGERKTTTNKNTQLNETT